MSKGFSSPNTKRRKLLTTSSKVIVSSPTKKKKVWREGRQWRTKCLRPLVSLKPSRFLEIATAFRISGRSRQPTNSPSESSLSTQMGQLVIFPGTKSKKIGTASWDPRLIWRSKTSLGSGTWVELAKPDWLENTQVWGEGGASPWDTRGKSSLRVYQGSRKRKAGHSIIPYDSPWVDLEKLSPLEGLGVRSLLFREEEEVIEQQMYWEVGKSKKIGTASRDPRLIWRSKTSLGSGTWAELAKPDWLENTQVWGEGGASPWDTWGKNRLGVYQESRKGKAGRSITSCTSPCANLEEPLPSKGMGECSLLFCEKKSWNNSATRSREVEGIEKKG